MDTWNEENIVFDGLFIPPTRVRLSTGDLYRQCGSHDKALSIATEQLPVLSLLHMTEEYFLSIPSGIYFNTYGIVCQHAKRYKIGKRDVPRKVITVLW